MTPCPSSSPYSLWRFPTDLDGTAPRIRNGDVRKGVVSLDSRDGRDMIVRSTGAGLLAKV